MPREASGEVREERIRICTEGERGTHAGGVRSKNAGTSNHNAGEKAARRQNKVSLSTLVGEGLVGPKGMVRTAPDGHTVNIP